MNTSWEETAGPSSFSGFLQKRHGISTPAFCSWARNDLAQAGHFTRMSILEENSGTVLNQSSPAGGDSRSEDPPDRRRFHSANSITLQKEVRGKQPILPGPIKAHDVSP